MHSHFLNGDYGSNIYRAGTYVNQVRAQNHRVILLDSGGSLAGSLAAYYYAIVAPYKRHPMIKLMNRMHYDASGVSQVNSSLVYHFNSFNCIGTFSMVISKY